MRAGTSIPRLYGAAWAAAFALACAAAGAGAQPAGPPPAAPAPIAGPITPTVPAPGAPAAVAPPSADAAAGPAADAKPAPPAAPNWLPDLGFDAFAEANRKFWTKLFDPEAYRLPPGLGDLKHPPGTVVIETRACAAEGGVPDCIVAAKAVCEKRGFTDGRPLDSQATRTCPREVTFGLRQATPGECRTDYTIASALCW